MEYVYSANPLALNALVQSTAALNVTEPLIKL